MVDRCAARNSFCLEARAAPSRDQLRRWTAVLLDGRHICSITLSGPKTRLLFDEHVERVCAVDSRGLGSNSATVACCGCDRGGPRWFDRGGWSAVCCGRSARRKRKLGNNGCALDCLESVARYARLRVASAAADDRDYGCIVRVFLGCGALLGFQRSRKTRCGCTCGVDDPCRAEYGCRGCKNSALFLAR